MKGLSFLLLCLTLAASASCFFDRDRIVTTRRRLQASGSSPEDPSNNFANMKVPMSIYELSSPVDYLTTGVPSGAGTSNGTLNISPLNHDANYILIAAELKAYEDAYSTCINALSDNDFSDETVDNCVGINYNYVYDDCDYEKSKILARADSALRDFMIQNCYTSAGVDLVMSNACDLIETDAINLLWNELDFGALLDYHRNKYLFEYSYINETIFNTLVGEFQSVFNETNSLLQEMYDHRELTVAHLEDLISRRTSDILNSLGAGHQAAAPQVISITFTGDDWKKKNRALNGDRGYKPPVSRFLELNPKNMKVREKKAADAAAEKTPKQTAGKIDVDGSAPIKSEG